MSDYIVRATAANNQIRAFAATTKDMVETARAAHDTSPVATAALGRLMTGAAMMGVMMKGDKDVLTLQIKCSGPIGGLTVTADAKGRVKGYVNNPKVMLPANENGKLDVGGALDLGILSVIKDMGLKEPYVGQTELKTGEIGDDLTYYFASSEQVPSAVGLGVLMEKNNTVKQAGGFIIQLMPFAEEEVIEQLEKNLAEVTSVTEYLDQGYTPEMLLEKLLGNLELEITERTQTGFYCNCDKIRVGKVLLSLGEKELQEMIDEGKEIELNCHFCNSNYTFSVDELKELLELARR
ncbi:MAG: Hsp33 family molecular chaperone HslO [Clostridia bacterium]|nr:Hsp33 family molecular chaperone HslO [Clostridia bacterium]NCC42420.1 Hsp33 family molecular chaperone HslO [Clostridia bacterium]